MIPEADESLRALLRTAVPSVSMEPAEEGPGAVVTLRSLREDTTGLPANWEDLRDERGVVIARRPPIRRYELRYTVTANADTATERHRMLDALLATISRVATIDPPYVHDHFTGWPVMIRIDDPDTLVVGDPPLGLRLVVTAPMLLDWTSETSPPPAEFALGTGRSASRPTPEPTRPPRPLRTRRVPE